MKDFLKKLLKARNDRITQIRSAIEASNDVNEVRSLTAEASTLQAEAHDLQAQIDAIEAEEQRAAAQEAEQRDAVPADAQLVNGNVRGSFATPAAEQRDAVDPLSTMEYRNAFMAYVQNGTAIPSELRAGDAISTPDTAPAIPLTIMNQVINTVRLRYGNLYNKVRHLNVKGGIQFPIGALRASFKWINESTVSPRQKLDPLAKIMFSYHVAEIRIAQTFLASIVTLDAFEAKIAEVIAIAYLEAMDQAIVNGTGEGMPLGILNDPRVTNSITMTAKDMNDWTAWRKNFFAKLPLGYREGEFIFPLSTVETYLETMADANNNPVFRQATGLEVNDGDSRNPNGRFFGRDIALVEPDILPDFDSASSGDVIGIFWQPEEYALNENFGFTMRRWFDEEANEWVDKALVVVDGKVLNPVGYYLIKKG
ncbi:phage major capsid protein [uncultured Methanobrevibacter sp.]|uniref:phage major capsid protein n=1 Tax=uncultured Methanobrevibacter sp. TaxID=253161 RepID=UPI00260AA799|nr:phage major capsid protein [uncultured Methanobrevibacter sp.]